MRHIRCQCGSDPATCVTFPQAFPEDWRTMDVQHSLFRAFSRQGAAAHELVVTERRQFPFKLFRLLVEPGLQTELVESCAPSRDDFTAGFLEHFAGRLLCEEAMMELTVLALAITTTTARLESINATIRRRVTILGTQTHPPSLDTVSAEFILGKFRRKLTFSRCPPGHKSHGKLNRQAKVGKPAGQAPPDGTKRRRGGGGGAWRAFTHVRCRGGARPDFRALADEFRSLTPAERQVFVDLGRLAVISHRAGGRGFGSSSTAAPAALRDDAARRDADAESTAFALVPYAADNAAVLVPFEDISSALKGARIGARAHRKLRRQSLHTEAEHLRGWLATEGIRCRDRAAAALSFIAPNVMSFAGAPAAAKALWLHMCCPVDVEVPRALGLRKKPAFKQQLEALKELWQRRHDIIFEHEQDALPDERPRFRQRSSSCD